MSDKKNLNTQEDLKSLIKNTPTLEDVYGKQDIIDKSEEDSVPVDIWDNTYYSQNSFFGFDDEPDVKRKRGRPRLSEEEIQRRMELTKNRPKNKRGPKPKTAQGESTSVKPESEPKPKKKLYFANVSDDPARICLTKSESKQLEKFKKYFLENAVDGKIIVNSRDLIPVFGLSKSMIESYLKMLKIIGFATDTRRINHKINTILEIIKILNGEDIDDRKITTSLHGIANLIHFMESSGVIEFHPENYQKLFDRQNRLIKYIQSTNELRKSTKPITENLEPFVRKNMDILYDYLELQQNTTFFQKPITLTLGQISDVLKNFSVPMIRTYLRALRDEGRIHFVYRYTSDSNSGRIIRLGPGPNSNVKRVYNNVYPREFTINPEYLKKVGDSEENADQ